MAGILEQAVSFALVIGGFSASVVAIANSPIGKFISKSIKRDISDLILDASKQANEVVESQITELAGYTRYHLGPNGASPALHSRIERLEETVSKSLTQRIEILEDHIEGPLTAKDEAQIADEDSK